MNKNDLLAALEQALTERNAAYAEAWKAYRLSTGDADPVSAWSALWHAMGEADKSFDSTRAEILGDGNTDPLVAGRADAAHTAYSNGYGDRTTFRDDP